MLDNLHKPKVFVIAGTIAEYNDWCRKNITEKDKQQNKYFVYVAGPETLRGFSDPEGVFTGTWRKRADIREVLLQLQLCCRDKTKLAQILNARTSFEQQNLFSGSMSIAETY